MDVTHSQRAINAIDHNAIITTKRNTQSCGHENKEKSPFTFALSFISLLYRSAGFGFRLVLFSRAAQHLPHLANPTHAGTGQTNRENETKIYTMND